jgi:RNA-directed DNA polymerase
MAAKRKPKTVLKQMELMEKICSPENLMRALKHVESNKGAAGTDGMGTEQLGEYLRLNWNRHKEELINSKYKPEPVRRKRIPKPDGGERELGIPNVLDRFIQQAILQILQPIYEEKFSQYSYGFRPGRSAHDAVNKAQEYINSGKGVVVDIDLERFFDTVNHDKLMSEIAKTIDDKSVLKVLRAYLNAGVMDAGIYHATEEGTPQGGPLSPLLSNIVLDKLDKELEKRGHAFVRYADDCNIYVGSERAGLRVMESVKQFITKELKLKVNEKKSAVDKPSKRKFLGFTFTDEDKPRRKISDKSIKRFKDKIREKTNKEKRVSVENLIISLNVFLSGWIGYYGKSEVWSILDKLDAWIRRRIRSWMWKGWKTFRNRAKNLVELGTKRETAFALAQYEGCWVSSNTRAMKTALSIKYITLALGLKPLRSYVKG